MQQQQQQQQQQAYYTGQYNINYPYPYNTTISGIYHVSIIL
jgi:hypothetical protein